MNNDIFDKKEREQNIIFENNFYNYLQNNQKEAIHSINQSYNPFNIDLPIQQSNFININENNKKEKYNIVDLLSKNPNINSYIDLIDNLTMEELELMFSFILNNIDIFCSNVQSYLLIDKIIYLYNQNILNEQNKEIHNNIRENIYSFLTSFFNKRIPSLIYSNNYISSIINLVIKLGYPKNNFIFIDIESNFKAYGYNRQGCILIQNLFPLGNAIQRQNLFNIILNQYKDLIIDKYGHYLFKYLLYKEENGEKYYDEICNKIINDAKKYTSNKYSSVVIERLLDSTNSNIKGKIINKICENENDVVELLYHPYGNYVLQKIIGVAEDNNILGMIYKTMMKNKNSIYKLSYGKKIMKAINVAYILK